MNISQNISFVLATKLLWIIKTENVKYFGQASELRLETIILWILKQRHLVAIFCTMLKLDQVSIDRNNCGPAESLKGKVKTRITNAVHCHFWSSGNKDVMNSGSQL